MLGSELFATRPSVHFALDDDDEDDEPTGDNTSTTSSDEQLTTARSSPLPTPHAERSFFTVPDLTPPTPADRTLFSFDEPATPSASTSNAGRRSSDELYPPKPLKSSTASKEIQFDQDDDRIDDEDDADEERATRGSPVVLMKGLLEHLQSRISLDGSSPTKNRNTDDEDEDDEDEGIDGEQANEGLLRSLQNHEDVPEWVATGAGLLANIANMSNSILGAGIIGLPYALREAGFVMGITLLVVLGIVTDWTIRMIVLNAKMSGRRTYIDIMDTCFGRRGRAAVSFFQFAFAFGGMCAFCVILGDTIPRVLVAIIPGEHGPFLQFLISRQFVITILTVGISYPLSLYRDIAKLSSASTLALISMVVIVVSVGVRGPTVADDLKGDPDERWTFINSGFFEAIGVISFAFVCHHNSLLIYGSLRTPTLDRFAKVTHVSTTLSVVACLAMSTSGFLVFTNKTAGNILNNFAPDDTLINVARACLGANMFSTLPLEAFVCREVLENYFWPDQGFDQRRHVIITTSLVFSAMLVSLITCDLGLVLELAGGFSATALAYLFPAACYLKLSATSTQKNGRTRFAAWICTGFGVCVMVLSTFLSINKALTGISHKQC